MSNVSCPWHQYSEPSARASLARGRKRGEDYWTMFHCVLGDHWHVIPGTFDEWLDGDPEIMRHGLAYFPTLTQWKDIFTEMGERA